MGLFHNLGGLKKYVPQRNLRAKKNILIQVSEGKKILIRILENFYI